jgi:galactokinase
MKICDLKNNFIEKYGEGETRVFVAPARVNLIGEHVDYNGGYVLPCAISQRSACVVRKRTDNIIQIASTSFDMTVTARIDELEKYKMLEWGNYQIGIAYIMRQMGYKIPGMDMLFDETVPHGSGLSSSAAIEIAMAIAIAKLGNGENIDYTELAVIGQRAENEYVGMNCGIMDQFASTMGKKSQAILLKCADLTYEYLPFDLGQHGYTLVIANTMKPRSLVTSAYNTRRKECDEALADICIVKHFDNLCDISEEEFENLKKNIYNPVNRKRATHVVQENARVLKAAVLLRRNDIESFAKLMIESHLSLRDLYEVTGNELDVMFESMEKHNGCIGSRMTGAGFGGCAVAIVREEACKDFCNFVGEEYKSITGYTPQFYIAEAAEGAREAI